MSAPVLSSRDAYQLLKDIALGVRLMHRADHRGWSDVHCGAMPILVDGWRLTLFNDGNELDHCIECIAPDGRSGSLERWSRHGTDPVQLLSRWEREELERLLRAL